MIDYAEPLIKLKQLTNKLETALNDKKFNDSRTLLNDMDSAIMRVRVSISALEIDQDQIRAARLPQSI
jgi:hypothetical protein